MNFKSLCSELGPNQGCGTNIELKPYDFGPKTDNLVYMNKVFSLNRGKSSPISVPITDSTAYTREITFFSPKDKWCCCANDFEVTAATTFNVTNSYVLVRNLTMAGTTTFADDNVTLNGAPVTTLIESNKQYQADISSLMPDLIKCKCLEEFKSSQAYFYANNAGPWDIAATIVLEGTAINGASSVCFRMCFTTPDATPITTTEVSTFALSNVSIPCSVNGISPVLMFNFKANAKLLSPVVTVTVPTGTPVVNFTGTLILEPSIELKSTRPSLFKVNAAENYAMCDELINCCDCTNRLELDCFDSKYEEKSKCGCRKENNPSAEELCDEYGCGGSNYANPVTPEANETETSSNCKCSDSNDHKW